MNSYYWPLPVLSCLLYICTYSVWWRLLKWTIRGFAFSRISLWLYNNNLFSRYSYYTSMEIFKPPLFSSHATSHKADWILTTDCCLLCLAIFICACIQSDKGSWNGTFGVSSSREFLFYHIVVFVVLSCSHASCCSWFTYN